MSSQASLFDPVQAIHDRHEDAHAAFYARVRRIIAAMYRGQEVTTDEVWAAMERYGIDLPPGASPNILGSFFASWKLAEPAYLELQGGGRVRKKRPSRRPEAHGNALTVWRLAP